MNELKLKVQDQRLASAEVKTAGELHPINRNEEKRSFVGDQKPTCQFHSHCQANCRYKKEVIGG